MGLFWIFQAILFVIIAITIVKLITTIQKQKQFFQGSLFGNRNKKATLLLIIAHPDDESMFFIPTIKNFQTCCQIQILCMSNGNFNDLGRVREKELQKAAELLRVDDLKIIDHPNLQDGMKENWNKVLIKKIIEQYCEEHKPDIIVTFDKNGVSSHPNHIATFEGAKMFWEENHENIKFYELISVNIIRKYIGIFDIYAQEETANLTFLNLNIFLNWKAMQTHYSQFVWFRKLFVFFSRYGYINTLKQFSG